MIKHVTRTSSSQIKNKLEKAEKIREDRAMRLQMKQLQAKINQEEAYGRSKKAKETKAEIIIQMYQHKQRQAEEKASENLIIKIQKAQNLGRIRLEEVRKNKIAI